MDNSLKQIHKIICSKFPDELLDKNVLIAHFKQFGKILKIHFRSKSRAWTIQYDTIESTKNAIALGGKYKGHVFNVTRNDKNPKRIKKDADPDWTSDPEVQKELDAMGSLGSSMFKQLYNLRSEAMTVDTYSPIKEAKIPRGHWKATSKWIQNTKVNQAANKKNVSDKINWQPEQTALLNVLKQPAITLEDKFKVLDARDKLIRLRTKKSLDITDANHLVGTCPDMCPEKERLMREIQHQVAMYEQDASGKMNQMLAVKQYSRSSADQEVPLPHDLRPVSVLQLTMGYLMHHIMNLGDTLDVNIAEWYHFLWDRTRSIRKDITQQALCCQGSVLLLEQCARFHIHCSAHLVAEDVSIFDHRINTENLTKCLQTLKYMYHDLHIKGESCPNEAEFRAYIILLNLNDGNFMWEVQQLKQEIQKSPAVRFALKVYSALDKNNYINFFKLVHSTTYLNACILMRYFVQVRTKALATLVRCYSPRTSYTQFALTELQALLAFEDLESVKEFIIACGLYLNDTNSNVILDKKKFATPLIASGLDRAIRVVESKRQKTVGEIVCDDFLPPPLFENYTPSNSFNENGIFIISDTLKALIDASPQKLDEPDSVFVKESADIVSKPSDFTKPSWSVTTDSNSNTRNIFEVKSDSLPAPVGSIFGTSTPKQNEFSFKFGNIGSQTSSIFGGVAFPAPTTEKIITSGSIFGSKDATVEVQQQFSFGDIPSVHKQFEVGVPQQLNFGDMPPVAKQFEVGAQQQFSFGNVPPVSKQFEIPKTQSEVQTQLFLPTEDTQMNEYNEIQHRAAQEEIYRKLQVQLELERLKQFELEKQQKWELEQKERNQLLERQKQVELEQQRQYEIQQKQREKDLQKQVEKERERVIEYEKQKRIEHEQELEKIRIEEENLKKQCALLLLEQERKLKEEIKNSVKILLEEVLVEVEDLLKHERLKEISASIQRHKLQLFAAKWRKKISIRKKKRQAMDQNPIWVPFRTTEEEANELFMSTQTLALQNIKRYKLGHPTDITLPSVKHIEKINIPDLYKLLTNAYAKLGFIAQTEFFWKLTVSLPDFREFRFGLSYLENILTEFFGWKDRYGTTAIVDKYLAKSCFHYSIEKKQGIHSVDGNSNGLLFIMNEITGTTLERISSSLKNLPNTDKIPIACVIINNDVVQNIDELKSTISTDIHVDNYTIVCCTFTDVSITEAITKCLPFLIKTLEKPPPLELNLLGQFLKAQLATELWKKVATFATWNSKYKRCLRLPNVVINLYNEAIDKLKDIITDTSCQRHKDFCDDFELTSRMPDFLPCNYRYFPPFWKTDSYNVLLLKTMNSLKLPNYDNSWPPIHEADLEENLIGYLSKIFEESEALFYKVLSIFLRNIDRVNNFSDIGKVSWIDVIELLVLEKLQKVDFSLRHTEFHTKSIFQEMIVVYDISKLDFYDRDEWFYLTNRTVEAEIQKQTMAKVTKQAQQPSKSFIFDVSLDELEKSVRGEKADDFSKRNQIKSAVEELGTLMADLEESMNIHKVVCSHLQSTVKSVLNTNKKS